MKELGISILDACKKTMLIKPHPAGMPFIIGGAIATVLLAMVSTAAGILALLFTMFCLYFFRDPVRIVPQEAGLIISPADGIISAVEHDAIPPSEITALQDMGRYTRISVFLSVLDVHVNRIPLAGKIAEKIYQPGKFFNADLDKASEYNERCSIVIEDGNGLKIGVVQIAGLIARRIINDLSEGQPVSAGDRFGIIRFGSRVDIYLPSTSSVLVYPGQRAIGGETILANLDNKAEFRKGVAK